MIKECIEIKKKNPDFDIFATSLNISAHNRRLTSIIHIMGGQLDTTDGYILRRTKLDGTYQDGCYQKIYRSNSRIFLAQSEIYGYPDFANIFDAENYGKVAEMTLEALNAPTQYIVLIRLSGPINIDYKYFSMLRGDFSVWFKDHKSPVIFKTEFDTWAIMPLNI